MRAALGLALAAGCAAAVAAGGREPDQSDVISVRLGGDTGSTRIVIDLRRATTGPAEQVDAAPGKVAVLLTGASAPAELKGDGRGVIRGWRIEDAPGGALLTLDMAGQAEISRRFLLPPADGIADYRYVIDLVPDGPVGSAPAPAAPAVARTLVANADIARDDGGRDVIVAPAAAVRMFSSKIAPASLTPAVAAQADLPVFAQPAKPAHLRKIVVIDPGHGGKDSGALGSASFEKNVTLATALALKTRLEQTGRYQVVMTRATDVFVPLDGRVQIARRAGADLFLSLHADSAGDATTHGASVYTLSERGEQRVGYVMDRNDWFLKEGVSDADPAVGPILLDLTQRTTRNRSATFAQTLIERVGDRAPLLPRSQRDAGYFVLLAPDVPAALLEMGFITNPSDEARLNDPQQRAALVGKIAQAIDAYFTSAARVATR
ncbi:MAG TPA: N-acetylmuramoyl-L-alanine amidase [Caulobacteraceae bacterium]|nr:N-acetylmuramoyl-L-alanine amidase [Caulobacteraceae bacterium]